MCPSGRVQDDGLSYWTGSSWTTHRTPKNTYISCSGINKVVVHRSMKTIHFFVGVTMSSLLSSIKLLGCEGLMSCVVLPMSILGRVPKVRLDFVGCKY